MPPELDRIDEPGWRLPRGERSLREVHGSISVPTDAGFWRKLLAFAGPGYLVAVGYMDPGNWATDLAGGARYGYTLLSVILLSNLMAILLQALAVRLGIASGRDLAQACRDHYSRPVTIFLWILCEIAIAACDLAEVIGAAIALNLLFGLPLIWGVCLTALDVLIVLFLQHRGFRYVEALVVGLILMIAGCFAIELWLAKPAITEVAAGFIPTTGVLGDAAMLYIAIGILGATVMPHNLYLHSSIVQTRRYADTAASKAEAIHFASIDSGVALMFALFINAAILVMAAATFHGSGNENVADIGDAYKLLTPLLGTTAASVLFAVALLFSGQNATLTGTLAGQIVMEGFVNLRLRPWLRRLITRLMAIIPAIIVVVLYGERGTGALLIASQVVLSLQLPFAVFREDGRVRRAAVDEGARVDRRGYHCGAQRVAAVPDAGVTMYRRILVAIEHSPADQAILDHVRQLAMQVGAELHLVHVADGWAARNFDQLQLRESEEMKDDRDYLAQLAADLTARGLTVSTELAMGDPATELIRLTEERGVDLLAMSTHGHRFLNDLVRGTTVNRVRHLVKIPVLLLRAQ
jgi:manganese transport protein